MRAKDQDHEDRQNPGLPHDAGRRGEADRSARVPEAGEGEVRDGVPGVGRGLDEDTGSATSSGFGA